MTAGLFNSILLLDQEQATHLRIRRAGSLGRDTKDRVHVVVTHVCTVSSLVFGVH